MLSEAVVRLNTNTPTSFTHSLIHLLNKTTVSMYQLCIMKYTKQRLILQNFTLTRRTWPIHIPKYHSVVLGSLLNAINEKKVVSQFEGIFRKDHVVKPLLCTSKDIQRGQNFSGLHCQLITELIIYTRNLKNSKVALV